jgi:hypothetical protein
MPTSYNTRERPRIELEADGANKSTLSAADSLRLHWREYLMEAGEAGFYCSLRARLPPCCGTPLRQSSNTCLATLFAAC